MGSSTDAADNVYPSDGLELVTGAGLEDGPSEPESGPERHTLILDEPPAAGAVAEEEPSQDEAPLPHEDVYRGDGDEIDLIDGIDPQPEYEPALIDLDDDAIVIDQPEVDAAPEAVEVPDTLMAVDDYGDVL